MKKLLIAAAMFTYLVSCSGEPQTLEELSAAGKSAFTSLDYPRAIDCFRKALEQKSSDRDLLYLLGLSYLRSNMCDSAVVYLKRADILYPNDREINQYLYNACQMAGDWANARKALRIMIQSGDSEQDHLQELSDLSIQTEDFVWAHYYNRKLLELYPEQPDRYLQLANTAAQVGSLEVAIEVIDQAVEKFGPKPEFLINQGLFFATKEDYPRAEQIFRGLVAEDSTRLQYRINLAHSLVQQDTPSKMREGYEIYCRYAAQYPDPDGLDSILQRLEQQLNLDSTARTRY